MMIYSCDRNRWCFEFLLAGASSDHSYSGGVAEVMMVLAGVSVASVVILSMCSFLQWFVTAEATAGIVLLMLLICGLEFVNYCWAVADRLWGLQC